MCCKAKQFLVQQQSILTIFNYHVPLVTVSNFSTGDSLIVSEHITESLSGSVIREYYTDLSLVWKHGTLQLSYQ